MGRAWILPRAFDDDANRAECQSEDELAEVLDVAEAHQRRLFEARRLVPAGLAAHFHVNELGPHEFEDHIGMHAAPPTFSLASSDAPRIVRWFPRRNLSARDARGMIRRILVPLDGSPYSETATLHACDFAARTGAEVFGKAITEGGAGWSAKTSPHAQAARWDDLTRHDDREEEKHRLDDALDVFAKTCADAGITCHQAHLQGVRSRMMIEQSIFYDLIVTGFHGDYGISKGAGPESLGTLLGRSITPFLVVPRKYREIRNVLVCFDGSLPAMRALQDFAPVAEVSNFDITILTAGQHEEEARYLLKRAGNYLRSYGVENFRTVAESVPIEKAVQEAGFFGDPVDLIVMGTHSRHAVRDFFMGSVANDLLKLARVPLFLGQ